MMGTTLLRHRANFERPVDAAGWYVPVTFEVPRADLPGLSVSVRYARDQARVDIGLFDPNGFRGWSGSERSQVWLGPGGATPGYLPGELPAGTWAVWLGLYVVPDGGIEVDIDIAAGRPAGARARPPTSQPARPRPPGPPPRLLPGDNRGKWLAGDLHCHTVHSDGSLSVAGVAALARRAGLDFLAVTDHNTISHLAELPAASAESGVQLVPGQEITNYAGHANAFGLMGWVDFRQPADDWMAAVSGAGGLLSVNHPTAGDTGWRRPMTKPPHLIELWPGGWDRQVGPAASDAFAARAGLGSPVPVGGSDFHRPGRRTALGRPTTWVLVEDGDVLGGLRSGHTTISADRDGPVLLPADDGKVVVIGGDGTTLCDQSGQRRPVGADRSELPAGEGVHWLEGRGLVHAACDPGPRRPPSAGP